MKFANVYDVQHKPSYDSPAHSYNIDTAERDLKIAMLEMTFNGNTWFRLHSTITFLTISINLQVS
jgi:hypothetical protein